MIEDPRNVTDEFKGVDHDEIVRELDSRGVELEIAIENLERDFNMGTIVRSANAFGVRKVHVIGRKQWNKRGAMATDKYLHVHYYATLDEFITTMQNRGKQLIAIDNTEGSTDITQVDLPKNAVLIFGAEGPGISRALLDKSFKILHIPQIGSTRSLNVGVAAGIAMWEWVQNNSNRG